MWWWYTFTQQWPFQSRILLRMSRRSDGKALKYSLTPPFKLAQLFERWIDCSIAKKAETYFLRGGNSSLSCVVKGNSCEQHSNYWKVIFKNELARRINQSSSQMKLQFYVSKMCQDVDTIL